MKQWEIWTHDFAEAGPHPAIIISHPDRVTRSPIVNVLLCSSHRATRSSWENEILLDAADGLDWETLVKCDLTYLVKKHLLYNPRGVVTPLRRRQLVQKMIASFGFDAVW